jgi:CheY-like chemotaxis protein
MIENPLMAGANGPLKDAKIVLCVDDAAENRNAVAMVLLPTAYTFAGAASGEECLKLARQTPPKLVLLDIQMPGMDGFETCRQLRRIPQMEKVPIAFLTVRKAGEDVKKGLAAGGNDFIVKPFDHKKLLARVQHWIDGPIGAPAAKKSAGTTVTWNLSNTDKP